MRETMPNETLDDMEGRAEFYAQGLAVAMAACRSLEQALARTPSAAATRGATDRAEQLNLARELHRNQLVLDRRWADLVDLDNEIKIRKDALGQELENLVLEDAGPRSESDGDMLARMGTNGEVWAEEFTAILMPLVVGGFTRPADARDLVFTWFANAIEAGKGAAWHDAAAEHQEKINAIVTAHRRVLKDMIRLARIDWAGRPVGAERLGLLSRMEKLLDDDAELVPVPEIYGETFTVEMCPEHGCRMNIRGSSCYCPWEDCRRSPVNVVVGIVEDRRGGQDRRTLPSSASGRPFPGRRESVDRRAGS